VGEQEYHFFAEADIHDAELLDVRVIDGSRPVPLGEPARPWQSFILDPTDSSDGVAERGVDLHPQSRNNSVSSWTPGKVRLRLS
jgi:hypothetical protein